VLCLFEQMIYSQDFNTPAEQEHCPVIIGGRARVR
jgi:hypothetical protein